MDTRKGTGAQDAEWDAGRKITEQRSVSNADAPFSSSTRVMDGLRSWNSNNKESEAWEGRRKREMETRKGTGALDAE